VPSLMKYYIMTETTEHNFQPQQQQQQKQNNNNNHMRRITLFYNRYVESCWKNFRTSIKQPDYRPKTNTKLPHN